MDKFHEAIKNVDAQRKADRENNIFHHGAADTKKVRRAKAINALVGELLISCCEKANLIGAFCNFAEKMTRVNALYEEAERLKHAGAPQEEQGRAIDAADDEFMKRDAYEEVSDDSYREDLEYAGDYNDSIARGGAEDGHIKMTLFYM